MQVCHSVSEHWNYIIKLWQTYHDRNEKKLVVDKVVKAVVILLYNPTKTVGVKKGRLEDWYKLPGMANNGCYKDEGKCMGNSFSKPAYVWTLLCEFSSESWDLIVFDWTEWYRDGWQSIFSFYKKLLLHVFISGKVVTTQRKSQNMWFVNMWTICFPFFPNWTGRHSQCSLLLPFLFHFAFLQNIAFKQWEQVSTW